MMIQPRKVRLWPLEMQASLSSCWHSRGWGGKEEVRPLPAVF